MNNPFFKNNGPFYFSEIIKFLDLNIKNIKQDKQIYDIKDLVTSNNEDISFFHSKKYKDAARETKASICITTEALKKNSESCSLIVENVLISTSRVLQDFSRFY